MLPASELCPDLKDAKSLSTLSLSLTGVTTGEPHVPNPKLGRANREPHVSLDGVDEALAPVFCDRSRVKLDPVAVEREIKGLRLGVRELETFGLVGVGRDWSILCLFVGVSRSDESEP